MKRSVLFPVLLALSCGCQSMPSLSLKAPEMSAPKMDFPSFTSAPGAPVVAAKVPPPAELRAGEDVRINLQMAREFEKSGHDKEAILYYEKVRGMDPKTPGIAWKLGVLHTRLEEFAKAMEEFKTAYEEDPKNSDLLNDVGYGCYQGGKWAEAETWFRRALDANPKNTRAQGNLGLALGQQGKFQAAFDTLKPVSGEAGAYHNLGMLYVAQRRNEDAKAAFRQALAIDPTMNITKGVLEKLENPSVKPGATATKTPTAPMTVAQNMTPPTQDTASAAPAPYQGSLPTIPLPSQGGVETVGLFVPPSAPGAAPTVDTKVEQAIQWKPVAEEMTKNATPKRTPVLRLSAPVPVTRPTTEVSSEWKKAALGEPMTAMR